MRNYIVVFICLVGFTGAALADDPYPPSWRNAANTMWAEWDNWAGFPGPMAPDNWGANPGGLAQPTASAVPPMTVIFQALAHGRANVIIPQGGGYNVWFDLDNYEYNPQKDIRIQITYNPQFGGQLTNMRMTGWWDETQGTTEYGAVPVLTSAPDANGWVTSAYDFVFQPNPWNEKIELKFGDTAFVDQVVIDTLCPEPTTLLLLGLGCLAMMRRRR